MQRTVVTSSGVPCLFRLVWFVLVGWWLAGIWIIIAWILNLTVIGLPIGLTMLNRVPAVLTLQPVREEWLVEHSGAGSVVRSAASPQLPLPIRAIYFVLIGWWLSLGWCVIAYLFAVSWIGLPIGLVMFNAVGLVTTLRRR